MSLIYLLSYDGYGKVSLQCSDGCACEGGQTIDGHSQAKHSVPQMHNLEVWMQGGKHVCTIQVGGWVEGGGGECGGGQVPVCSCVILCVHGGG